MGDNYLARYNLVYPFPCFVIKLYDGVLSRKDATEFEEIKNLVKKEPSEDEHPEHSSGSAVEIAIPQQSSKGTPSPETLI